MNTQRETHTQSRARWRKQPGLGQGFVTPQPTQSGWWGYVMQAAKNTNQPPSRGPGGGRGTSSERRGGDLCSQLLCLLAQPWGGPGKVLKAKGSKVWVCSSRRQMGGPPCAKAWRGCWKEESRDMGRTGAWRGGEKWMKGLACPPLPPSPPSPPLTDHLSQPTASHTHSSFALA